MASTPNLFPPSATVACQGVEGAYSQLACEKLFKHPQVMYFGSFESVFSAIENGFCDYGVLPLENSTAGSVKQIYDLMLRHSSFKIVRSTRLKIDHNLVAKKGTKLEDIKEIFSHPQAISQCSAYLEKLGVVVGYPDGLFHAEATITREQFAVMLYRFAQEQGYDVSIGESTNILSYTDVADLSEYAISAMQWAVGAGIINGTGDGSTLSPQGQATRAQAAVMLMRFCEEYVTW